MSKAELILKLILTGVHFVYLFNLFIFYYQSSAISGLMIRRTSSPFSPRTRK